MSLLVVPKSLVSEPQRGGGKPRGRLKQSYFLGAGGQDLATKKKGGGRQSTGWKHQAWVKSDWKHRDITGWKGGIKGGANRGKEPKTKRKKKYSRFHKE